MRTDACRAMRESLGAYALGQLPEEERPALEAHLDGCPGCRAELESLASVARAMPLADPERFAAAPVPPPELAERVATAIRHEERSQRRRRRLRFGLPLGAATAAATAALLVVFVFSGGTGSSEEQRVSFAALPPGMKIVAALDPQPFGTEIHMYVEGIRSGTLCKVTLRGVDGARLSAGTFRYRHGTDEAVLSSALDLSRTRAIVVRVGGQAFVAPVGAQPRA